MNFGKTINKIRESKKIPVKHLISGLISYSTYTRFVNGQNDTSASTFITLLDRLHVSLSEFAYIDNGYQANNLENVLKQIQTAIFNNNIQQLSDIRQQCINQMNTKEESVTHLIATATVLLDRLKKQQPDDTSTEMLHSYLAARPDWNHYELSLFNNTMFTYKASELKMMLPIVMNGFHRYSEISLTHIDAFKVLVNALTVYLEANDFAQARLVVTRVQNYPLEYDMFFEKTLRIFFSGVMQLLDGNSQGDQQIQRAFNVLRELDDQRVLTAFRTFYNYIKMEPSHKTLTVPGQTLPFFILV